MPIYKDKKATKDGRCWYFKVNYTVMGTFNDNMLINLEKFRADMYNIEPEKQNIHPILFKSHKKR